jgi:hypothetical protein
MITRLTFVMDELVDVHLGIQVGRGFQIYKENLWERLPFLTLLISWLADDSHGAFRAMISVRRLMWVATAGLFVGVYYLARGLFGVRSAAWSVLLLAGFSNFLDRSIRVRTDLLSTALSFGALYFVCASTLTVRTMAIAGLCLGLAFITTQKAAYFVLAFAVALTARAWIEGRLHPHPIRRYLLMASASGAVFFIPLGGIALWAQLTDRLDELIDQCFRYGVQTGLVAQTYSWTTIFMWESMERSPGFWAFGIIGAAALTAHALRPPRDDTDETRLARARLGALGLWSVTMLALIGRHTVKFPYVFMTLAPCLALAGAFPLSWLGNYALDRVRSRPAIAVAILAAVAVVLVGIPARDHFMNLEAGRIVTQRQVMERAEALAAPDEAIFDGIGIVVTRRRATPWSMTARWQQERMAGADYDLIGALRESRPTVSISNYRMKQLFPLEQAFITRYFVHDWANVFVVGTKIEFEAPDDQEVEVDLLATADYAILSPDNLPVLIDGRQAQDIERLEAGKHRVAMPGHAGTVTIKLARAIKSPPESSETGAFVLAPPYHRNSQ